jgi:hypothetical protein
MEIVIDPAMAPQQSFFTHWLWLPFIAITFSLIAMLGPLPEEKKQGVLNFSNSNNSFLSSFTMRFSVIYWFLYLIPEYSFLSSNQKDDLLGLFFGYLNKAESSIAHFLATHLFKIEGELILPNGSGDTTYNYLLILGLFVISFLVASIWTLLKRHNTYNVQMRDLLRSLLRHSIALVMVGYGLAKFHFDGGNQFPNISNYQLNKTWGDSSPMNVLWAFMGASQVYTMFAGLGEIVAGLLLVWRRTCILGALVALGVMINVMMLNYSYDVPVKLYSTHLVVMSMLVLAPDAKRLFNFLVLNRPVPASFLGGVWQSRWSWWTRLVLKTWIVGGFVLLPVSQRIIALPTELRVYIEYKNQKKSENYRLTSRGFRWINEVPFNR